MTRRWPTGRWPWRWRCAAIRAGEFVAHPDGVHLGLSVAQGQDGTNSYWLHLDEGRIVVRELPGETLAGVAPSGVHYLDLPHVDTQLAIRRFADDRILASCAANDVPGFELHDRPGPGEDACDANGLASWLEPSGYRPNDGAGAYLDDDHVLTGVFTAAYDQDETELHLVLSARSLHWAATVDYGQYGRHGRIRSCLATMDAGSPTTGGQASRPCGSPITSRRRPSPRYSTCRERGRQPGPPGSRRPPGSSRRNCPTARPAC
jgi:hypothetical protein